ncbi:hypothetical protein GPOL_c10900 [Gordonia polyisoprenivorans VH2]|uniref:Glycoside hydrolase family 5 domain-containing protein n=1 Tax=Gordonia polyisoprenivorans (strain DSM 44266 / VH2) TaxID=1112204 RepID=H6N1E1_GORPV|nr:hypothetical protein [Gordonia polyisoprenivorans]AFA72152.1 hypothetical protein GPOL_c10900 [Gordonia polyisoprenivorans VH2]
MHALATPLARRIGAGALAVGIAATMAGATMWSLPSADPATTTDLAVALSSVAEEPTQLGVTDGQIYRMSDAELNATLDNLQALGVTDLRVGAPLSFLHQDGNGWARLDTIIDGARARGMNVVIVASVNSPWTRTSGPTTASTAEFAGFAKLLASRYRGKVAGYEVWNDVGSTISALVPAEVLQDLLDAARAAIQAADPGVLVRTQQILDPLPTPPASAPDVTQTVVPIPTSAPVAPSAAPVAPAPDTNASQAPVGDNADAAASATTPTSTPSAAPQTTPTNSPATNSPATNSPATSSPATSSPATSSSATQTVTPDNDPPDTQPGDDPGDTATPEVATAR